MHTENIQTHCLEIERCNQRGGRMLSLFDLLEADTLPLNLAAWLMGRISLGDSFMIGALPGGAGKTTVMGALLNCVAPAIPLIAATPEAVRSARPDSRTCYICHEIGNGPYFAYLWGNELRQYARLSEQGHQLSTNLHADDLEEAYNQVVVENGVTEPHFRAIHLLIFLRVSGSYERRYHWIEKVYYSNGLEQHHLVYNVATGLIPEIGVDTLSRRCQTFLQTTCNTGIRMQLDTRKAMVHFLLESPTSP